LRQGRLQIGLERVRRVDDEHAAGGQAGANHLPSVSVVSLLD
jgi:hypothetical protein